MRLVHTSLFCPDTIQLGRNKNQKDYVIHQVVHLAQQTPKKYFFISLKPWTLIEINTISHFYTASCGSFFSSFGHHFPLGEKLEELKTSCESGSIEKAIEGTGERGPGTRIAGREVSLRRGRWRPREPQRDTPPRGSG